MDFVAKDNGCFLRHQPHTRFFLKNVPQTLNKELVIGTDRIRALGEEHKFLSEIKTPYFKDKKVLLLIERVLDNRSTLSFVRTLKTLYEDMYIVVLTSEVERQVLILLHEIGVGNFITNPVSLATLSEKIASPSAPGQDRPFMTRPRVPRQGQVRRAIALSDKILKLKPGSAAASWSAATRTRARARSEPPKAPSRGAQGRMLYLEPHKKLADLYMDEGAVKSSFPTCKNSTASRRTSRRRSTWARSPGVRNTEAAEKLRAGRGQQPRRKPRP